MTKRLTEQQVETRLCKLQGLLDRARNDQRIGKKGADGRVSTHELALAALIWKYGNTK